MRGTVSERSAVQNPVLKYAQAVGWQYAVRATLLILTITVILLVLASLFAAQILAFFLPGAQIELPLGPTPRPPTILAPRGELPLGPGGLKEWTQYDGGEYGLSGSGFFLRLSHGAIVGLTTAHSAPTLGLPGQALERIAFGLPEQADHLVAEFDTLHGLPGVPRFGDDLTVDYVLLQASTPVDEALALSADPRGAAQLGEPVTILAGVGDWNGGRRAFGGTVVKVDEKGAWAQMDEVFEPGMMSGSPFVSDHTGLVVGMAIAAAPREGRLFIGFHPIGRLVQAAEAAREFPKISAYRR